MAKIDDTDKMLDELVKGKQPEELLGEGGVLKQLTKRIGEIIDLGRARRGAGAGSSEWVSSSGSVRRREGRSGAVKEQAGE